MDTAPPDAPSSGESLDDESISARLTALEARVERIAHEVERLRGTSSPRRRPTPPVRPKPTARQPVLSPSGRAKVVFKSEDWLSRIGVGLLLFGLAFLFKYSVDQGWIGPAVRVAFGAALGVVLLGAGVALHGTRRRFGQVLMGGGIATGYATVFAAFQLYHFLSYSAAFGLMVIVTGAAFLLSVRYRDAILAIVATQGGLATPFLLYASGGSVPALMGYTSLILGCALGLYLFYGWRALLATAVFGGWLVLAATAFDARHYDPIERQTAFAVGVLWATLLFGGVPLGRALLHKSNPTRWPRAPLTLFKRSSLAGEPALVLAPLVPLVSWLLTFDVFGLGDTPRGLFWLGIALVYGVLYVFLHRAALPALASAHGMAVLVSALAAGAHLLDEPLLRLAALAGLAAITHLAASQFADRWLRIAAHILAAVASLILWERLVDPPYPFAPGAPLVRPNALLGITTIACVGVSAWWLAGQARLAYLLTAYVLTLGWLWSELTLFDNGLAYVSVAWGLCALALLIAGAQRNDEKLRWTGLATLLLVIAKLFVIDLAELDALWRILLFLGFGTLLVVVSYFFPALWRSPDDDN